MDSKPGTRVFHLMDTYEWTSVWEKCWRVYNPIVDGNMIVCPLKLNLQQFDNAESAVEYAVKLKEAQPEVDVVVELVETERWTYKKLRG